VECRKANFDDLPAIMKIIRQAKEFMKSQGLDQWQTDYPAEIDFRKDIERGDCYVLTGNGTVAAVFVLSTVPEECYKSIHGSWLTEGENYAVVHRSAVSAECRGKGVGREMFRFSEELAKEFGVSSLRVDTHKDNVPMCGLLEKCGFAHCGVVVYSVGPEIPGLYREAYEKII